MQTTSFSKDESAVLDAYFGRRDRGDLEEEFERLEVPEETT